MVSVLLFLWKFDVARSVPSSLLPLSVCTTEEQRSVIRFLWSGDVSGAAVHQRLTAQYRNSVLL
jgi:hypothetical protein